MFMWGSLCSCDINDDIDVAKGAREGQNVCIQGLIWVHLRAVMGSCEQVVMG